MRSKISIMAKKILTARRRRALEQRIELLEDFLPSSTRPYPSMANPAENTSLDNMLAVATGSKPCAYCDIWHIPLDQKLGPHTLDVFRQLMEENHLAGFHADEVKAFLEEKGLHVYVETERIEGRGEYVSWFVYSHESQLAEFLDIIALREKGQIEPYHRQLGQLLGYPHDAIQEFVEQRMKGDQESPGRKGRGRS